MILDIYSSLVFPIGITSFIRLLFIDKGSDSVCNNQIKKGKSKQISKNLSLNGCQHRDVPLSLSTVSRTPLNRTRRVRRAVPVGCGVSYPTGAMKRCRAYVLSHLFDAFVTLCPTEKFS